MVEIRNFRKEDLEALSYELDECQNKFTRLPSFSMIERRDDLDPNKYPITILFENLPVGYFVLDLGEDKLSFTENENAVLIRSLSLNPLFQGRKIGKKAMIAITEFVHQNFINCDELVLAVNFKNVNAHQLYLKSGFVDGGKTSENRNGPQHILTKKI